MTPISRDVLETAKVPFLSYDGSITERFNSLFRIYQVEVHPFASVLPRIEIFEAELCEYVQARAPVIQRDGLQEAKWRLERGRSIPWISSLFAILACGSQFCMDDASKRQEKSRVFCE